MSDPDIVWEGTVETDHGRFDMRVIGENETRNRGRLIVTELRSDVEILNEGTGIAYGALSGPEDDDIAFWYRRAMEVIHEWIVRKGQQHG